MKDEIQAGTVGFLCCSSRSISVSPEREPDRVEKAFKRMDKNNDGFITWEEFTKVELGRVNLDLKVGIIFLVSWLVGPSRVKNRQIS